MARMNSPPGNLAQSCNRCSDAMIMAAASHPSHAEQPEQVSIFIVDDNAQNIEILRTLLGREGYHIQSAHDGAAALAAITASTPDLILLDVEMPHMDGFTVCQQLRAQSITRDIPVIFISANGSSDDIARGFTSGGRDYITRPFHAVEVLARIRHHLSLGRALSQVRHLNAELEQRVEERTRSLASQIIERDRIQKALEASNHKLNQEIAERRRAQSRLMHTLLHDGLTQLPNRAMFMQRLTQSLQAIKQNPQRGFAVLVLDCDRFKLVNDAFGHPFGDQLLIAIAKRLTAMLGSHATLARLGGDEFAILLDDNPTAGQAITLAKEVQRVLQGDPFALYDCQLYVSVSIGILLGTPNYQQPEHLLRDADTAMYQAKASGRNTQRLFDAEMRENILQRLDIEHHLQQALNQQQFRVYYQPMVDLKQGTISGFEALVRWAHPEQGMITPNRFIPVAEETGLIVPLGNWLLREACRQARQWQTQHADLAHLNISVNLSIRQFMQPDLLAQVDAALAHSELAAQHLKLEITESVMMDNDETVTRVLQALQTRQVQLSLDDFGTGYSSLSYLHRFPINLLKIDQSFISRIGAQGENQEIVQAIITLADNLGMDTVAEGVETPNHLKILRELACDQGQGYLFSRPLSANAATQLLMQHPRW